MRDCVLKLSRITLKCDSAIGDAKNRHLTSGTLHSFTPRLIPHPRYPESGNEHL